MDVTAYDPQAVANAEAKLLHLHDLYPDKTRGQIVTMQMQAQAQVIAGDVVTGRKPWPAQVEEYRYLRDLPWDGGQPPAPASRSAS